LGVKVREKSALSSISAAARPQRRECQTNSGAASDATVSKSSSARANKNACTVRALAVVVVCGVCSTSPVTARA